MAFGHDTTNANGIDGITRERRLEELRTQLRSHNATVVAWAAWRAGDERITEVRFELRKAAQRWGRRADASPDERTAHVLLDALVQIGAAVTVEELHTWRDSVSLLGPVVVLAARAREFPKDTLLAILDDEWTDETRAERQAAGNLLAAQRSPEIVAALLGRAVVMVHVDVIDPGGTPGLRKSGAIPTVGNVSRAARADLPPRPRYTFWRDASGSVPDRIAGPVDVAWTRELGEGSESRGVLVANTTSSGRTYAADLLAWLAEPEAQREPFGDIQVIVEANDLERGRERAHSIAAAARQRWERVLAALERAGLLSADSELSRSPRIGFETKDWRANQDVDLPAFGDG